MSKQHTKAQRMFEERAAAVAYQHAVKDTQAKAFAALAG